MTNNDRVRHYTTIARSSHRFLTSGRAYLGYTTTCQYTNTSSLHHVNKQLQRTQPHVNSHVTLLVSLATQEHKCTSKKHTQIQVEKYKLASAFMAACV